MIPSLTPVKSRRNKLISLRTGFTYISNVAVLAIALLLFATIDDPKE
jgi:Na+/melibiose symporter-like transporter